MQQELDFASRAQVVAHLGKATVQSVMNIVAVVADTHATFTWEDVEARLPDGIKQQLELVQLRNASGGLMTVASKLYGYRVVDRVKAKNPKARGRMIALWARKAA